MPLSRHAPPTVAATGGVHAPHPNERHQLPASSQSWVQDLSPPVPLRSVALPDTLSFPGTLISPEQMLLQKSGRVSAFEVRKGKPQISVRSGKGGRDLEKEATLKSQESILFHWPHKQTGDQSRP